MTSPLEACRANPNLCVPYILMASYLYYHKDVSPPTSDTEFDTICKLALDKWDEIRHRHKKLIKRDDLRAGTLYSLPEHKYPLIVKGAAYMWLGDT